MPPDAGQAKLPGLVAPGARWKRRRPGGPMTPAYPELAFDITKFPGKSKLLLSAGRGLRALTRPGISAILGNSLDSLVAGLHYSGYRHYDPKDGPVLPILSHPPNQNPCSLMERAVGGSNVKAPL